MDAARHISHARSPVFALRLVCIAIAGMVGVKHSNAQTILVRSVKPLSYPLMQASVYAFDTLSAPKRFSQNDRRITENGSRQVLASIGIPPPDTHKPVNILLALDCHQPQDRPYYAAMLPALYRTKHPDTRIAIVCFAQRAVILQDFTSDTTRLAAAFQRFPTLNGGADFTNAFLDEHTGIISLARRLQERCHIVFVHNGNAPFATTDVMKALSSLQVAPTIHTVSLDGSTQQPLRDITNITNGFAVTATTIPYFKQTCAGILRAAQGAQPSTFIWNADRSWCFSNRSVRFESEDMRVSTTYMYTMPDSTQRYLEISSPVLLFGQVTRGKTATAQLTLTARGDDIVVTGMLSSSPLFQLPGLPASFALTKNESRTVTVSFTATDTLKRITEISITSNSCRQHTVYAEANSGINPALIPELVNFTGGSRLLAGTDSIIHWRGVMPTDTVIIDYSTDAGLRWMQITDTAQGMAYRWRVPDVTTIALLLRIKQRGSPANPRLSDSLNTISQAGLQTTPLDFGEVQEGSVFVKRFDNAICNPAPVLLRIDSITVPPSAKFTYASGLPSTLFNGSCASPSVAYSPQYSGTEDSIPIRYHTTAGVVQSVMRGYALPRKLITPRSVYFGVVSVGETRDTLINIACILNTSEATITSATIEYGESPPFTRSETSLPLTLNQSGACWSATLRFTALTTGRTSARLIITTANNEVHEIILAADVVCGLPYPSMRITIPDTLSATIGEQLVTSVRLSNTPTSFLFMKRPYKAVIAFNRTMLSPRAGDEQGTLMGDERIISLQGRGFNSGDTLFTLILNTALGNNDRTPIRVTEFRWQDECNELVEGTASLFITDNICKAGGKRLFIDNQGLQFRQIAPNPTSGETAVQFSLRENGITTLEIFDMLGNHVRTVFTENLPAGVYEYPVDVSHLVPAQYTAVLSTPTRRITTSIGVVR
ncbi:MAG: choice-of-anchor D domain-containing protein [Candidatus Kapabacteria bacterium]|nr:choice-of-anchor D domain-containing protein [Candidatus Kapabacteria bacterium]